MRSGGEGGVSREGGRARRAEIQSRLLGALTVGERGVSRENGVSREGGQARRVQVDKRLLWVLAIAAGAVLTLFVLWIGPWLFTRHPSSALTDEQKLAAKNDVRTTLVQAVAGLAVAGGAIVTYRRFRVAPTKVFEFAKGRFAQTRHRVHRASPDT